MNKEYVLNKLAQSREPEYFNYSTVSKQVADSLHSLPPDKKKNVALFNTGNTNHMVKSNINWIEGAWPHENKGTTHPEINTNSVGMFSGYKPELGDKYPGYKEAIGNWNKSHFDSYNADPNNLDKMKWNINPFNKITFKNSF